MRDNTLKLSFAQLDRGFWRKMFSLALPISIQQMLTASFGLIDVGMIGQVGEIELASVGLIGKLFFVSTHLLGGLSSGASILAAQYYGKNAVEGSKRTLGIALRIAILITLPLTIGSAIFPITLMELLSDNEEMIQLGADYVRITSPIHLLTGITLVYGAVIRGIQKPRIPMAAAVVGILVNTFLNYLLIFGHLGCPKLGVQGAAYATVVAKIVELVWLVVATYVYKLPIRQRSLKWLVSKGDKVHHQRFIQPTLPMMFGEFSWSMGVLAYYVIYAHIGTEALAAMSLLEALEGVFIQFFIGFGSACAIMISSDLGASEPQKAYAKGIIFLVIIPFAGMLAGMLMLLMYFPLNHFFGQLGDEVLLLANEVLMIMGASLFVKLFNMVSMLGVLRSGGDTRYTFMIDLVSMWSIGVPLAVLAGVIFELPLVWVYIFILVEEIAKMLWSLQRILTRKWLNNLVNDSAVIREGTTVVSSTC